MVHVASLQCTERALRLVRARVLGGRLGGGVGSDTPERRHAFEAELGRRKTHLLLYLLQSPLFNK